MFPAPCRLSKKRSPRSEDTAQPSRYRPLALCQSRFQSMPSPARRELGLLGCERVSQSARTTQRRRGVWLYMHAARRTPLPSRSTFARTSAAARTITAWSSKRKASSMSFRFRVSAFLWRLNELFVGRIRLAIDGAAGPQQVLPPARPTRFAGFG